MSSLNLALDSNLLSILNEAELMTLCCLLEATRPSLKDRGGTGALAANPCFYYRLGHLLNNNIHLIYFYVLKERTA